MSSSLAQADTPDPNDKFYELATMGRYQDGKLAVSPYEFSITWINGVRQSDDDYELMLKPDDIIESLVCEDRDRFVRYRLDKLTPTRAYFTRWIYASIRIRLSELSWKYQPGRLRLTDTCELDLINNGLLVDYGPNNLQFSGQKTLRSK